MADRQELENRFTYRPPKNQEQADHHKLVRAWGLEFSAYLESIIPTSRELSVAQTKIEEAVMWANAGIARRT